MVMLCRRARTEGISCITESAGWIHVNHKHRPTGSSFLWLNLQSLVTQILPSMQLQEASASKPISIYEQLKQKDWAQSFYWAQSPSSNVAHCLNRLMRLAHFPSSTLSRGWSPTQSQRVERQTIKPLVEHRGKRWCEKEYVEIYAGLLEAYDKPVAVVAVASFASTMCNAAIAFLRTRGKQPLEWRPFGLSTQFLVPDLASSFNEGRPI